MPTLASVVLSVVRICDQVKWLMELRVKLKLIRVYLGLTQDQMAERLGFVSESRRARVSEWEAGRGEPRRAILVKYSELVNIDIKQLIDDRENISFKETQR